MPSWTHSKILIFNQFMRADYLGVYAQVGGGGVVHPVFFVKLDFEIAVDQQTKAHDQTFEGVPDSGRPLVPAG